MPRAGCKSGSVRRSRQPAAWVGRVVLATLVAIAALASASVAPRASADGLDDEARAVAKDLRCPICQGLSVADSPSELAQQMRQIIRNKLAQGEGREAIMAYFVERYGEEALMAPPTRGLALLAWLVPLVALAGGVVVVALALTRWLRRPPAAAEDDGVALPLEEDAEAQRVLERWRRGLL